MTEALEREIRDLRSLFWSDRDPDGRAFAPLADAYRRAGDLRQALELLKDGVDRHPTFVSGHVVSARVYLDGGLNQESALAARRALELDEENVEALHTLAQALEAAGDPKGAADAGARLTLLDPEVAGLAEAAEAPAPAAEAPAPEAPAPEDEAVEEVEAGVTEEAPEKAPEAEVAPEAEEAPEEAEAPEEEEAPPAEAAPEEEEAPEEAKEAPEEAFDVEDAMASEEAEVVDIASLAPEAVDIASLAPEVVDIASLAPEVVDIASLAPEAVDIASLAPEPEGATAAVDVAILAPDEAEEDEALDISALAPDESEDVFADDEDPSLGGEEPLYTRTMADLFARQGLKERALDVYRHLLLDRPGDPELLERIAELESAAGEEEAEEGEAGEEESEVHARHLAAAGEGGHDVDTPFTWTESEAPETASERPPIGDYFRRMLTWTPMEHEPDEGPE